jgi:hypothetical protein
MFVCIAGTIMIAAAFQWLVFVPGVDTGNLLFKSVSSLAGGRSSAIKKDSKNVRIALDPDGINIIATYSDDLASQGSVVFDAGFDRFSAAAAGMEDDRRYVANIASWLQQNSSSSAGRNVLIYTVAEGRKPGAPDFTEGVVDLLRQAKFTVTVSDRSRTPQLTEKLLAEVGQIWLFFPESDEHTRLTDRERKLVSGFNDRGNGMLVSLDNRTADAAGLASVNSLTTRYGVSFSGVANNTPRISIGIAAQMFSSSAEMLGRLLKIVHKA